MRREGKIVMRMVMSKKKDVSSVHLCHDHTIYEKQKLIVDIKDEDDSDDSYSTKALH